MKKKLFIVSMRSIKLCLLFYCWIALLSLTSSPVTAQGTFSCAPAPICTINNISCDPDYLAPGNLGSNCQSLGYECGQKHDCIIPPPTPTPDPTSTNTYDCTPAPLCYAINIDCDSEHQVGPCGSNGVSCNSTGNPCIRSASLPNTCSCGPVPICAVLDNQCHKDYYCPCAGPNCAQKNIDCIKIGIPPPRGGIDIHGKCGKKAIDTAIGCIPVGTANEFIKWFLGRAILLAGGIAFLMMIAGAFLVIVSSGNPEKVKAGSQLITSAIAGLVFIIFSLFLLRLIGIEILQIPGL